MNVTRNVFTISDLSNWMDNRDLVVNHNYQRSQGLWPPNARSFFIDTILNGFPFPKVIIRQTVNLKTRKSVREIIDGQQRLTSIHDFINNKMTLTKVSELFSGMKYADLEEEKQKDFLSYEVSVDTIIGASEEEILEVFRRMNSYTLPLNEPEKRHAIFQGEFKWFISDLSKKYNPMFESYKIFNTKQLSRMEDTDLITDMCQVLDIGIEKRINSKLSDLYRKFDLTFPVKDEYNQKVSETLDYIKIEFADLCNDYSLPGYTLYSLFAAMIFNRWGIQGLQSTAVANFESIGVYLHDKEAAINNLNTLFKAVEQDDETGPYSEYVKANKKSTGNKGSRITRTKWLVAALQNEIPRLTMARQ